jgi:hypothetical protein
MNDAGRLLDAVIEHGSDADFAAWIATGRDGLLVLRDELTGGHARHWRDVHPKDAIDGLSSAAATIAAEHPDAFLGAGLRRSSIRRKRIRVDWARPDR